ncbi:3-isopropylmalate dehydratase large subunit, partial [Candidatus Micrarchaeota archaeon]|nr:3-isopropylmalate dehydratase large subunit [Candidatus Micrarchaeota archaeon]
SVELTGEVIRDANVSQRLTICNGLADLGVFNLIVEPDFKVLQNVKERSKEAYRIYKTDGNAEYAESLTFNAKDIEPVVAIPHSPNNIKHVADVSAYVDQVIIGGCTSGKLDDLKAAAAILKGKKIAPGVRLIIIPATQEVYKNALIEGTIQIFVSAGAMMAPPTGGVGCGAHLGVLADNEVCLTTTDRNFLGRMGSPKSKVYIGSPATAAATAIIGRITDPRTM